MSNVAKILTIQLDGKPRTKAEMAAATGLTLEQVYQALRWLTKTGAISTGEQSYVITAVGIEQRAAGKRDHAQEWARRQKKEAKARERSANARIREEAKATRCGSWPKGWVTNDSGSPTKGVPNSVFALGGL